MNHYGHGRPDDEDDDCGQLGGADDKTVHALAWFILAYLILSTAGWTAMACYWRSRC